MKEFARGSRAGNGSVHTGETKSTRGVLPDRSKTESLPLLHKSVGNRALQRALGDPMVVQRAPLDPATSAHAPAGDEFVGPQQEGFTRTPTKEDVGLARLHARLYGKEALYSLREQVRASSNVASLPSRDAFGVHDPFVTEVRSELPGQQAQLEQSLRANGFASVAEFDATVSAWRAAFERRTRQEAYVRLNHLERVLKEQQKRYADAAKAAKLAQSVQSSGAPAHYKRHSEQRSRSIRLSMPVHAMSERPIDQEGAIQAAVASAEAKKAGDAAIQGLGKDHPLLAFPDFPRQKLAEASATDVPQLMLDYISEHVESVRDTRKEVSSDPAFIYKLDVLLQASRQAQGIADGSIHARIIDAHMKREQLKSIVKGIALAVVTLALTVATLGGGAFAGAAGLTAFGLSGWQAVDAFRDYTRESDANDAQLLSEDPSIFWLVLAVTGAVVDLGAAVKAVRAIRPAAKAFNETGDLDAFREALKKVDEIDARIARSVERGAESQQAIVRQWQAVGDMGKRLNDITSVVAEGGYRMMVLAWHGARRGALRFDQYLMELKKAKLITRRTGLSAKELEALRGPYDEALRRAANGFVDPGKMSAELRAALPAEAADDAAAFGRFLGLSDAEAVEVLEAQVSLSRQGDMYALSTRNLRKAMRERATGTGTANDGAFAMRDESVIDSSYRIRETADQAMFGDRSQLRRNLKKTDLPAWTKEFEWEAHHKIPWEHRNHRVIDAMRADPEVRFDMNQARNGIALPKESGVGAGEPLHQVVGEAKTPGVRMMDLRGHPVYNARVKQALDAIDEIRDPALKRLRFLELLDGLPTKAMRGDVLF